jgi:hypothetical protein
MINHHGYHHRMELLRIYLMKTILRIHSIVIFLWLIIVWVLQRAINNEQQL